MIFTIFFENADLVKNLVFLRRNWYFSGFEPPKIDLKSMPKRIRKRHRKKTSKKLILASILASKILQNPFQIDPGREKIGSWAKLVSRRYATRAEVVANQRGSAFIKRLSGYAYD